MLPARRDGSACSTRPASSPTRCVPADVDETPKRGELPRACANRLARAKADAALKSVQLDDELRGAFILAADTVVAVGRRILPKANLVDEAAQCLRLLSGRNHRVYTAICLVTPKEAFRQRLIETRVRFKRLQRGRHPGLYRLRRMARQGRRLRRAGHRRHRSWSRWSAPTPTSSACRSTRPITLLGGEGFPIPLRLAECQLTRPEIPGRRRSSAEPGKAMPDLRQAGDRGLKAVFVPSAAATSTSNRWLSGRYVIPGRKDRDEDQD